jgi:hypothetical protein
MQGDSAQLHWWQTRKFVAAMALIAIIPLLRPEIPPLVDLPGHMGRYRVQLSLDQAPWLSTWYNFTWQLIGNLGIDLLVIPMAKLFGLELAVKLIVMTIPVLTVTGFLWIAREVHGRVPPTALFALPLAYSYPFQFGFVNFALSMALALNLFALWLRLARLGHFRLRAALFVPLSCALWVCHTFGWGVLGVLAFSAEMIRRHDARTDRGPVSWIKAWALAGLDCVPLALPLLMMVIWRSGDHVGGETGDWFNWTAKYHWVEMVLRDRWWMLDLASLGVIAVVLLLGLFARGLEYSRNLTLSALFLAAVFVLLPRIVFGSAYADMRLAPFAIGVAVIAIRPRRHLSWRGGTLLAALGLAFFLVRIAAGTASYAMFANDYDRELKALDHVPQGARLITFVGMQCGNPWVMTRLEHFPALALERKLAYANDQWSMAGGQLLTAKYLPALRFAHDPSQIVTSKQCPREWWRPITKAMARFPRKAFDYVWLVRPPAYDPKFNQGLVEIWRDGTSVLFRIDHTKPGIRISDAELKTARPQKTPY